MRFWFIENKTKLSSVETKFQVKFLLRKGAEIVSDGQIFLTPNRLNMSKTTHMSRLLLVATFLILFACKKNAENEQIENPINTEMTVKVNAWLDSRQAKVIITESKAKIRSLKENLDLSNLWLEDLSDGEKFLVVPVREELQSQNNKDKQKVTVVLFILNKAGELRKGNLVQFIPENKSAKLLLPINTFNKMYNFRPLETDGRFCFLSVDDKLLYQYDYKMGKLSAYGFVEAKPSSNNQKNDQGQQISATVNCTRDWYFTTTYYYSDGTSYTTYEYLYSTPCGDVQYDDPNGTGGTGGNGDDAEEAMPYETKDWIYKINSSGYWAVVPTEGFQGVKKRSSPGGGAFTSFIHITDGFMSTASGYSWTKNFRKLENHVSYATIQLQGDITHTFLGTYSGRTATQRFNFNQVYP